MADITPIPQFKVSYALTIQIERIVHAKDFNEAERIVQSAPNPALKSGSDHEARIVGVGIARDLTISRSTVTV